MNHLRKSLVLTLLLIVFFGVIYPLVVWGIGAAIPGASGFPVTKDGTLIGYENIGQNFSEDKYFWSRPSAVSYNAASTGGSNVGPTRPDYLDTALDSTGTPVGIIAGRVKNFLDHNPGVKAEEIPSELVTASGGGLDPHLSPQAALVQVKRVATIRGVEESKVRALVESAIENPYLGFIGTARVNVLKLNLALDNLK